MRGIIVHSALLYVDLRCIFTEKKNLKNNGSLFIVYMSLEIDLIEDLIQSDDDAIKIN